MGSSVSVPSEDEPSPLLIIVIVYVFVVPFSAVTVTFLVLVPTDRYIDPETDMDAPESAGVALMVQTVTSLSTFTVYDVLEAENDGDKVPADTLREARLALPEAEDEEFVTVTVVDFDGTLSGWPS